MATYAEVMADIRAGRAKGNGARNVKRPSLAEINREVMALRFKKPSKYRNVRCEVDGEKFDSRAEAKRWQMLKILQRGGAISDLERQVTVDLDINGVTVRQMRWDFAYVEQSKAILDDTKGAPATEGWLIKAAFLMALRPELELRVNGIRLRGAGPLVRAP